MDSITVDVIKDKHPAIAEHFTKSGQAEGEKSALAAERERVKGIRAAAAAIPGMEAVALELIELGVSVEDATKTMKTRKLTDITNAAPGTAGGGSDASAGSDLAHLSGDELYKAMWAQNKDGVQSEFTNEASFLAFMRADAQGRVRIQKKG